MIFKIFRDSGFGKSFCDNVEVAVHAPFGTYHGAWRQCGHNVWKIEKSEKFRNQVFVAIGERTVAFSIGFIHHEGTFTGAAKEVVIYEGIDGVIERSEHHQWFGPERESAGYDAVRTYERLRFHPVEYNLVLPGCKPEITPSGFEQEA